MIVNGFGGLANTWWNYATIEPKNSILNHVDLVLQLLSSLRAQFVGLTVDEDLEYFTQLYQLGNLELLDEYFFQMQD